MPVYKSGTKNIAGNYRLISIFSPFSKIFVKLICVRLENFLVKNDILSSYQFGFRRNHSTLLASLNLLSNLQLNYDKGYNTCCLFLDLSKAFDTVNHQLLLQKRSMYGVRGNMFMLLKDYLTDRLQFTACNNTCSTCNQVLCEVPQGSTLGPLIFILYINDLPDHTNFNVRMFADDTVLFIKSKKLHELKSIVTSELHKISEWTKFNRLSLNLNKTTYMIIYNSKNKNKEKSFKLRLCENDIKQSHTIKYFGLNLQSNLKSNDHLNYVYKKVSQAAGIISKIMHYVNKKTLLMMYYFFVYCHLQYGILTWANTNKSVTKPLKTLQNHILIKS